MVKLTAATSLAFFQIALLSRTSVALPMPVGELGPGIPDSQLICSLEDPACATRAVLGAAGFVTLVGAACFSFYKKECQRSQRGDPENPATTEHSHSGESDPLLQHEESSPKPSVIDHCAEIFKQWCKLNPAGHDGSQQQGKSPPEGTRPGSRESRHQSHEGADDHGGHPGAAKRDLMQWDRRETSLSDGKTGARSLHDFEERSWEKFDELD